MGTGTAAPIYGADSTYRAESFSVYVESTDRIWWACTTSGFGGSTATPGRFAIIDPADMSIAAWTTGESGTWDGPRKWLYYDPVNDVVWSDWTGGSGDQLSKYGSDGALLFEASMPTNCSGPFVNRATGDAYVLKQDPSSGYRVRWLYLLNPSDGTLSTQLYDLASGSLNVPEADASGRIWFAVTDTTYAVHHIDSDGSNDTTVWTDTGAGHGVSHLVYDSTHDRMLASRPSYNFGGSTRGSVFLIDCTDDSYGSDIAVPETDGTYTIQGARWSNAARYDPHRDLYWWLRQSNGAGPQYEGNDITSLAVAFDPTTFAVVYSVPVAYLGTEVDPAPFKDNPGNDFITPYDVSFDGIATRRAGTRVYWVSKVQMWDDDASNYLDFQFLQWWESDAAPVTRRYAILNVMMRRR